MRVGVQGLNDATTLFLVGGLSGIREGALGERGGLLVIVQEGTLQVFHGAVFFGTFLVAVLAGTLRLHETAQGILPLLLLHNFVAQPRAAGRLGFLVPVLCRGALRLARLFIPLLLTDPKEAHWASSFGVRREYARCPSNLPRNHARVHGHNADVLIISLILSCA